MKQKIKPGNDVQQGTSDFFETGKNLKRSLLLILGTLVPCGAAVAYAVQHLREPGGSEIKKLSLLLGALALLIYLVVLMLCASIDARRDRKKITAMVTELTENLSANDVSTPVHGTARTRETKSDRMQRTETLVKKIVQVINA